MVGPATEEEAGVNIGPLVAVVGPCGAGKTTLVNALRTRGVRAREVAQEHSYVPAMWLRITRPDLLIYLAVSREAAERRVGQPFPSGMWERMLTRLAHARAHADLLVETAPLSAVEVLELVLQFLQVGE